MGRAGAGDKHVRWLQNTGGPVRMRDDNLRPGREGLLRFLGDLGMNVDRRNFAGRADQLGQNGSVVPRSASEMRDAFAGGGFQVVKEERSQPWLAIVEAKCLVEGNQRVVVDVARFRVLCGPIPIHAKSS
jgi:hypothetical protein